MEYTLQKGCALVLVGSQGCGKSTLARKIAAAYGSFVEVDATSLEGPFGLGRVLEDEPQVVIVNDLPDLRKELVDLKTLIDNDQVLCHRKGKQPKAVKSPHFIFCTGDASALRDTGTRRFFVVDLSDTRAPS